MTQGSTATKGDVLVLLGTRKGLLYCPAMYPERSGWYPAPTVQGVRCTTFPTTLETVGPSSQQSTR